MLQKIIKAIREGTFFRKVRNGICDRLWPKMPWDRVVELRRAELQEVGMELMEDITRALAPYSGKYFADYGTLLGLVRDGKTIAHDCDMDFGVYLDRQFTWKGLEKQMKGLGLKKLHQFTYQGKVWEQTYVRRQLTVDFFAHFDDEKGNSCSYCFYRLKGVPYRNSRQRSVIFLQQSPVRGVHRQEFQGRRIAVPDNSEEYLASIYTESWRQPDPDWDDALQSPAWHELPGEVGTVKVFRR